MEKVKIVERDGRRYIYDEEIQDTILNTFNIREMLLWMF